MSWIPENSDGERNSLGFCAGAVSLPKTNSNDAQPAPTSEIVAERILGLFEVVAHLAIARVPATQIEKLRLDRKHCT